MATPQPNPTPKAPVPLPKDDAFVAKVQKLEDTLMGRKAPYSCSGKIALEELEDMTVYFTAANGATTKASLPLSTANIAALQEAGTPSSFGRGDEDMYDESYRLARELKPPQFALSVDPVLQGAILPGLAFRMGTEGLTAKLYKLNTYGTGGFFKAHRDTPRSESHVGTITVCLPSEFVGGQLVVRHGGDETTHDWGTTQDAISWAFLYSNCEHEVLPVTQGSRVTLAYDVFSCRNYLSVPDPTTLSDSTSTTAETILRDLVADDSFLPNGGILALGLQHEYPIDRRLRRKYRFNKPKTEPRFNARLKGQDAVWDLAVRASGILFEYVAVYDTAGLDDGFDYDTNKGGPYDPSGPVWSSINGVDLRETAYKGRMPFASRKFNLFDGCTFGDEFDRASYIKKHRVGHGRDVTWVTLPGNYGGENAYMTYGNQHNTRTIYVAVAIFVWFPTLEKRRERREETSQGGGAAAQEVIVQGNTAREEADQGSGSQPVAERERKRPRQLADSEVVAEK